jgi:hypothetical protein
MKYLSAIVLLIVAMAFATSGYSVGQVGGCLLGTDCGKSTFSGTLTADSFDSGPDDELGGSITFKECEDDTIAPEDSCPSVGVGHSLEFGLPDNADPLDANKSYVPGYSFMVGQLLTSFDSYDGAVGVHYCLSKDYITAPPNCTPSVANVERWIHLVGAPFVDGVFVDRCEISFSPNDAGAGGWDDGDADRLDLQFVVFDMEDIGHATSTLTRIGDPFIFVDATTTCAGLGDNCTTVTSGTFGEGSHTWQVHRDYNLCTAANTPYKCCTGDKAGATCAGTSTEDNGMLAIIIDDDSSDAGSDADMFITIICKYF